MNIGVGTVITITSVANGFIIKDAKFTRVIQFRKKIDSNIEPILSEVINLLNINDSDIDTEEKMKNIERLNNY